MHTFCSRPSPSKSNRATAAAACSSSKCTLCAADSATRTSSVLKAPSPAFETPALGHMPHAHVMQGQLCRWEMLAIFVGIPKPIRVAASFRATGDLVCMVVQNS